MSLQARKLRYKHRGADIPVCLGCLADIPVYPGFLSDRNVCPTRIQESAGLTG